MNLLTSPFDFAGEIRAWIEQFFTLTKRLIGKRPCIPDIESEMI